MDKIIVYFLLLSSTSVFAQNDDDNLCVGDQVLNTAGKCADPDISRNIYVFAAPDDINEVGTTDQEVPVPKPKLEYNIVFVKAPEGGAGSKPIVIPPPQQKTIVYVLSKKGQEGNQPIIEVPAPPKHKPEVYYVNYAEGENPVLPGGVDLKTALDSEAQAPKEVGAGVVAPATVDVSSPEGVHSTEGTPVTVAYGYSAPEAPPAPVTPAVVTPTATATPTGGVPLTHENLLAQPQQPNIFIVTPQPPVFLSPQGGLGNFHPSQFVNPQGGLVNFQPSQFGNFQPSQLGNFQQLGFPAAQG